MPMDATSTTPREITVSREKREVHVRWQDGHESVYGFDRLRKECPCALCTERHGGQAASPGPGLTVLSGPVVRTGEIQVTEVKPVGRYALNFVWSDGHDSGIYSYAFLRAACPCPACREGKRPPG